MMKLIDFVSAVCLGYKIYVRDQDQNMTRGVIITYCSSEMKKMGCKQ